MYFRPKWLSILLPLPPRYSTNLSQTPSPPPWTLPPNPSCPPILQTSPSPPPFPKMLLSLLPTLWTCRPPLNLIPFSINRRKDRFYLFVCLFIYSSVVVLSTRPVTARRWTVIPQILSESQANAFHRKSLMVSKETELKFWWNFLPHSLEVKCQCVCWWFCQYILR